MWRDGSDGERSPLPEMEESPFDLLTQNYISSTFDVVAILIRLVLQLATGRGDNEHWQTANMLLRSEIAWFWDVDQHTLHPRRYQWPKNMMEKNT